MPSSTARFETENGSKYLQQLCKHFAHKIEVSHTPLHGECRFSCGTAYLDADDRALTMRCEATDDAGLRQTENVIESHLVRFAFREPAPLIWKA